eukprot:scaffold152867_cov40-Attheya_sp.AAC.1
MSGALVCHVGFRGNGFDHKDSTDRFVVRCFKVVNGFIDKCLGSGHSTSRLAQDTIGITGSLILEIGISDMSLHFEGGWKVGWDGSLKSIQLITIFQHIGQFVHGMQGSPILGVDEGIDFVRDDSSMRKQKLRSPLTNM